MFSFLKSRQNNVFVVVNQLLKTLNVKVSKGTLSRTLAEHPSYPSLLSISDSLSDWSVSNQAYQIDKKDYDPDDLFYPFIAHSNDDGGHFMLVQKIVDKKVSYSDEKGKGQEMSEVDFLLKWSGVALHATADEKSGEQYFSENRLRDLFDKMRIPLVIGILVASVAASINYGSLTYGFGILLILKLAGTGVCILLLMHGINANNPLIQNLCSLGSKNDCNAILKSDAAKVTTWLSWSEVGFFYFAGSVLALLIDPNAIRALIWINVLALPYTVYSLSYQYNRKNWCVLCCSVQLVLILEFLTTLLFESRALTSGIPQLSLGLLAVISIAFLVPIAIWVFLKPFLTSTSELKPLKGQLKKFKYNTELFEQALVNQPKYAVPDEIMPLILGNPDAETTITMVSNPFCEPCAKAHQTLDDWLRTRKDIKLKIIFTSADDDNEGRTKVSRHAAALSLLNDSELLKNALNDWYGQTNKKYEQWAAKYPVNFNGEQSIVTEKQKAWCDFAEIRYTPTILVNGYKLPQPYRIQDIKYLLS